VKEETRPEQVVDTIWGMAKPHPIKEMSEGKEQRKVDCQQQSEIVFKYFVKKLLIRKIIGFICLCIMILMLVNEPFWHLRPYVPESVAYIFNGPPRLEHYMSAEQLAQFRDRSGNIPISEETLDAVWAFYAKYGDMRARIWYLEFPRRLILISLFWLALPIIVPDLFANKRVAIRLTKEKFCWYSVWPFIPVVTENSVEWDRIENVELKRFILTVNRRVNVCYTDTDDIEKKKTEIFHAKYLEIDVDELFQSIQNYMAGGNEVS